MRPIKEIICTAFENLIHDFGLQVVSEGAAEVWLVGATHVIMISADIDGINLRYVDPGTFNSFDLSLYLVVRRGGVTALPLERSMTREEKLVHELQIDARLLSEKGSDILRGEKQWMKDYGWSPLKLNDPRDRDRVRKAVANAS